VIAPLTARIEPWMSSACSKPKMLARWVDDHGSPLNLIHPGPMARNAAELAAAADALDVRFEIFFARKGNKSLALVDEAHRLGLGIDVASDCELSQTLSRGFPPQRVIVTAAVKPPALLRSCLDQSVTVVLDNDDELQQLLAMAGDRQTPVAVRLAPTPPAGRTPSRFGFEFGAALEAASQVRVSGVHFHLNGYDAEERVAAITESLQLIDALRARGHSPTFLDIGGGNPVNYISSATQWHQFWDEHRLEPTTFERHPLARVYPYHQQPVGGEWLTRVLEPVAGELNRRHLTVRCEPGRALLDGCGMTIARVQFRKRRADGEWLIGVEMNRTQCRSGSDDFLVDPLVLQPHESAPRTEPIEGFLVGAYCIERDLLSWRRLSFSNGIAVGDLIVFPNTAGYLMHLLESRAHQMPLAANLVVPLDAPPFIDPIDTLPSRSSGPVPGPGSPGSPAQEKRHRWLTRSPV
jgi:diaminopimelate decarboxylase